MDMHTCFGTEGVRESEEVWNKEKAKKWEYEEKYQGKGLSIPLILYQGKAKLKFSLSRQEDFQAR
jgi:hypothetical protein